MHEDLKTLLDLLRSTDLEWLAREVEDTIEEGRLSCTSRDSSDGRALRPSTRQLLPQDELQLAIETIHSHLVQPIRLWDAADNSFRTHAEARIALVVGDRSILAPFDQEVRHNAEMFEQALAQLWPGGPAKFRAYFNSERT